MLKLHLERRNQPDETLVAGPVAITPKIDEDYWEYRVKVSDTQAVVGFPKFGTIGIGFAVEGYDWNVNLPYTCGTDQIYDHIKKNQGDEAITSEDCVEAIRLVQEAARADRAATTLDTLARDIQDSGQEHMGPRFLKRVTNSLEEAAKDYESIRLHYLSLPDSAPETERMYWSGQIEGAAKIIERITAASR